MTGLGGMNCPVNINARPRTPTPTPTITPPLTPPLPPQTTPPIPGRCDAE